MNEVEVTEEMRLGYKKFIEWRKKEIEKVLAEKRNTPKWLSKTPQWLNNLLGYTNQSYCSCIRSVLNPSWASEVHYILFHVCNEHGAEFGIWPTPYWEKDIERLTAH